MRSTSLRLRVLAAACSFIVLAMSGSLRADIILDVDSTTAGPQATIAVTSGTVVTVTAYVVADPLMPSPFAFDGVGLDLSWAFPGDTATVSAPSAAAGPLASFGSGPPATPSLEFVTLTPITGGSALTSLGVPTLFPGTTNFGGSGFFDPFGGAPPFFSGMAFFPAPPPAVELMSWSLTVTGSPGDFVTVHPSGIFSPVPPLAPPGPATPTVLPMTGGGSLYNSTIPMSIFQFGPPVSTFTITIVAVPEASAFLFGGMVSVGLGAAYALRRRRQRR
jgi:hypothetical protein